MYLNGIGEDFLQKQYHQIQLIYHDNVQCTPSFIESIRSVTNKRGFFKKRKSHELQINLQGEASLSQLRKQVLWKNQPLVQTNSIRRRSSMYSLT